VVAVVVGDVVRWMVGGIFVGEAVAVVVDVVADDFRGAGVDAARVIVAVAVREREAVTVRVARIGRWIVVGILVREPVAIVVVSVADDFGVSGVDVGIEVVAVAATRLRSLRLRRAKTLRTLVTGTTEPSARVISVRWRTTRSPRP